MDSEDEFYLPLPQLIVVATGRFRPRTHSFYLSQFLRSYQYHSKAGMIIIHIEFIFISTFAEQMSLNSFYCGILTTDIGAKEISNCESMRLVNKMWES